MSEDVTINIRDIQHYMYCPRRFALLEVNDDWAENAFVVKANLLHENVFRVATFNYHFVSHAPRERVS